MTPERLTELAPSAYVVEEKRQHCCHCGRQHSSTAVWASYPKAAAGRRLMPVRKTSDVIWNLPIEHKSYPIEQIPFCHACYSSVTLRHLRKPATISVVAPTGAKAATYSAATTVKGGYAPKSESPLAYDPKPEPKPKAAKRVYSLDDIL